MTPSGVLQIGLCSHAEPMGTTAPRLAYRLFRAAMFPSCGKPATCWYLMSLIAGPELNWLEGRCDNHACTFEEVERSGAGFESMAYEEAVVLSVMST